MRSTATRVGETDRYAVAVQGLHVRYDDVEVVRGVDLTVMPGEIVSLLGPSGCGKTTTLRVIAGFVTPDQGDVWLDGERVTNVRPNRRGVGMVFQGYALFPHLSVFDNVAYGLRMRRVAQAEISERVECALALVRLSDYAARRPKQLSGGQQQRVAIARALVIDPKVLLLDEPLSNLDAKLRQEMRVDMRRLLKSANTASVFVTHDQEEAMVISDRIVLMNHGGIVQQGSPYEIYRRPINLFAAAFLGQANFLHGSVTDVSSEGFATVAVQGAQFRGIACGELARGAAATLVVKHERVRSVQEGARDADNVAECTFESLSFTGANIQAHYRFGSQHLVSLSLAPNQEVFTLRPGASMRLAWERTEALIFPDEHPAGAPA